MTRGTKIGRRLFVAVLLAAMIIGGATLVRRRVAERRAVPPPAPPLLPVETAMVKAGTLTVSERYLGTVAAARPVVAAPRIAGELVRVTADAGDRVAAGEELAALDDRELTAALAAREAELDGARRERVIRQKIRDRLGGLVRVNAAAEQDLDLAALELDLAVARVDRLAQETVQLKTERGYTRLLAPAAGVIAERLREPGDHVAAGQAVLTLECPAFGYRVVVEMPAARHARLAPGAMVALVAGESRLAAAVSRISPAASPDAALGRVEIDLDEPPFSLPSGSRVGVALEVASAAGSLVPLSALLFTETGARVFVVDDAGRVTPLAVTVRAMDDERAAVAGISPGRRVIVADEALFLRLHEGMIVCPAMPADVGER